MRGNPCREGLTGLEIIISAAVLVLFIYLCASIIFGAVGSSEAGEGGLILGAVDAESEIMVTDGASEGIEDTGGVVMDIELLCNNPNPGYMGSCLIPVRLLTGSTDSIDISRATVTFTYNSDTEVIPFTSESTISKPSWTIADKSHIIPFQEADEDIILEPNEVFNLVIYPSTPVPSEGKFSIRISPPNSDPLTVGLKVPPTISSKRIVELVPV